MRIKKSRIVEIVREELALHIREMLEAGDDEEEKKGGPSTVGADKDNDNQEPDAPADDVAPKVGAEKGPEAPDGDAPAGGDEEQDAEVPATPDPSDDELSKDMADDETDDGEDEVDDETGGDISDEITGKTIQSMTFQPESKMMPGAAEITIQFDEIPHPLTILIGKSGMVKYHFKGALHNEL